MGLGFNARFRPGAVGTGRAKQDKPASKLFTMCRFIRPEEVACWHNGTSSHYTAEAAVTLHHRTSTSCPRHVKGNTEARIQKPEASVMTAESNLLSSISIERASMRLVGFAVEL